MDSDKPRLLFCVFYESASKNVGLFRFIRLSCSFPDGGDRKCRCAERYISYFFVTIQAYNRRYRPSPQNTLITVSSFAESISVSDCVNEISVLNFENKVAGEKKMIRGSGRILFFQSNARFVTIIK